MLPVVTSLIEMDGMNYSNELSKTSQDKEQKEKREAESKDDIDESEKFLSLNQNSSTLLSLRNSNFIDNRTDILSFQLDVLTPPPERI